MRQLLSIRTCVISYQAKPIKLLVVFILDNNYSATYCDVPSAFLIYLTLPVMFAFEDTSFSKPRLMKNY